MIKGSCACGGIRFEIEAVRSMTHCHCTTCRKLTGASFATYPHVDKATFGRRGDEKTSRRYESAPGSFRSFCPMCGSLVPGQASYLATVSVPAGLLDSDPGGRPRLHGFTSPKPPWWEITDALPQHEKWVPGYAPKGSNH